MGEQYGGVSMKFFRLFFFIVNILVIFTYNLFASGKTDTEEVTLNNEWVLCITAFDYSGLPPAHRITGNVMIRDLVDRLKTVSYRMRISPEYAFYEGYAWRQAVLAAAKVLSSKQDERSLLLYRGEPNWKYKRNLKNLDSQIEKLKEELEKKEAEKPLINTEPAFTLCQANLNGTYPEPPKPGQEYRFCQTQKYDAILSGQIFEFHRRFYIKLSLYTQYTQSYIFEDDIIFSIDDSAEAVEEIATLLNAVLSGNRSAAVVVRTDPPESQILINWNYAGTGTVDEREHPPGKITVAVAAEGYKQETIETELYAGELAEIDISLSPLRYADVNIDVPGKSDVSVYHGSLFAGFAPLTLKLPVDQLEYVFVEQESGMAAKGVFATPVMPGDSYDLTFKLKMPPSGQHRVNKARARSYWAWGGVWITGITAWITSGIFSSQNSVLPHSSNDGFRSRTMGMYYVSRGALVFFGAAVTYYLIQMPRYLYTSTEKATPTIRQGKKRK